MFFGYVLIFIASVSNVLADPPKVVVLSFSDVSHETFTSGAIPILKKLVDEHQGAGPIEMQSIFPTKTMVTHTTIATGVYPRIHGVYNDEVFDPDYNVTTPKQDHFASNNNLLPIWIENQKEENGRNSGVMMWPGGEYEYQGVRAAHIQPFDETINWETRVDTIVDWMTNGENKANLVMASFENSLCYDINQIEELSVERMQHINATIEKLYNDLKSKSIDVEFIVLSDHGASRVDYNNVVEIDEILKDFKVEDYKMIVSGPIVLIKPVSNDKLHDITSAFNNHPDSSTKFLAKNIVDLDTRLSLAPDSYTDIIVVKTYQGYTFYNSKTLAEKVNAVGGSQNFVTIESGYDHYLPFTYTFFTGFGSKFKKINATDQTFEVVYVYQILKCLLNLRTSVHEEQQPFKIVKPIRDILIDDVLPLKSAEETDTENTTNEEESLENTRTEDGHEDASETEEDKKEEYEDESATEDQKREKQEETAYEEEHAEEKKEEKTNLENKISVDGVHDEEIKKEEEGTEQGETQEGK